MTSLHPEAQHLLDRYLLQVRTALAGCRSIEPSEVERDILDHVEAEFPGRAGPVSRDELEPILQRLGSPDEWVPAEQAPWWRRAAHRLRYGPEDWRLAYLAFGLLLSVVIRRAATAALVGFGIWLLVAIFGQLIVSLIAGVVAPVATAGSLEQALSLTALSAAISRLLPLTLYQEASGVLLNPTVTTVSTPTTVG